MNCIVVDDERIILDELCTMIRQTEIKVLKAFQDPHEAFASIPSLTPDVAFLDIEMPGLNGIELAKKIAQIDPDIQIVFVTAYEQYALKAFEVSAVHYLLKPITREHIDEAVQRVLRVRRMNEQIGDIGKPALVNTESGVTSRIVVKDRDDIIIIQISDIIYIRSNGGKTVVATKKGSYSSRSGLQFWESQLKGMDFIRCHRSFVVNAMYITKMIHILGEYKELTLDYCDVNIPISRQKVGDIKDWLGIE